MLMRYLMTEVSHSGEKPNDRLTMLMRDLITAFSHTGERLDD